MKTQTALSFYKSIPPEERDLYKLVNGLFIVKYINKEECVYIGEFLKSGCVGNATLKNKVIIRPTKQTFNKSRRTYFNGLGTLNLNIKFDEELIREILF